jgi:hypothetical protein
VIAAYLFNSWHNVSDGVFLVLIFGSTVFPAPSAKTMADSKGRISSWASPGERGTQDAIKYCLSGFPILWVGEVKELYSPY